MLLIDRLTDAIKTRKSPIVVGLDPLIPRMPSVYFARHGDETDERKKIARAIVDFTMDVMDAVRDIVPAVKPQMAFYEMYGPPGIEAFEETVAHARGKGLVVVEDAKRNDIGSTALAYAQGHLGTVATSNGGRMPGLGADFLTVTPYLGTESLIPFIDVCKEFDKGVFILVKTSNPGNTLVQNATTGSGETVAEAVAAFVAEHAAAHLGHCGLASMGAVVGATYPEDAARLRAAMPQSLFLVPGYGVQGGTAADILPCFNPDGLGAIVNASRSILYAYETSFDRQSITREEYARTVRDAANAMREDIYRALQSRHPYMCY